MQENDWYCNIMSNKLTLCLQKHKVSNYLKASRSWEKSKEVHAVLIIRRNYLVIRLVY